MNLQTRALSDGFHGVALQASLWAVRVEMTKMLCGCPDVPGMPAVSWGMVTSVCSSFVVWIMISWVNHSLNLFGHFDLWGSEVKAPVRFL